MRVICRRVVVATVDDEALKALFARKQFAGEMHGKRGEKPPLPRNCKRPFFDCRSHCP
jgi:hypothetical protein